MPLHHIGDDLVIAQILKLRPFAGVAVPGEFDTVEIGIVQVQGDVGAMVVVPIDLPAAIQQSLERHRQIAPGRIVDGEVIEPGRTGLRGVSTGALPSIQRNMVVVTTCREKRGAAQGVEQIEPEYIAIEPDGAVEIGDLEMHMTDMGSSRNGLVGHE